MIKTDPTLLVIFGATGDLAQRKLYPALFNLYRKNLLDSHFAVIGTARRPWTDDYYRQIILKSIDPEDQFKKQAESFTDHFFYQSHNVQDTENYRLLKKKMAQVSQAFQTGNNQLFYLSISPEFFQVVTEHLKSEHLLSEDGYNRVMIEKPFGSNLKNSTQLNEAILTSFSEEEIYRIDHYLGKEMTQSILSLRENNPLIESIWHHKAIDNIQITLAEDMTVQSRGYYYDHTGALRDMFQNHILQLMSLLLMNLPASNDTKALIDEKNRALQSVKLDSDNLANQFVRGQYEFIKKGAPNFHYRDEHEVSPHSFTETFVAGYLFSKSKRWKNTPIYFRTGKALNKKETRIDLVFKKDRSLPANILRIADNHPLWSVKVNNQNQHWMAQLSSPSSTDYLGDYETLIYEALRGIKRHFVHWSELKTSWQIVDQIRYCWQNSDLPLHDYLAGSPGPQAMHQLTEKWDNQWID